MKLELFALLFLVTVSGPAHAGRVLVVGPGPGQVADIQSAINAAIDGDVILVKAGTYPSFSIPNKELSILGETGQTVIVDGAMRVRNLSADRTVVLSSLGATGRFDPANGFVGNGFFATNCAGSIRLQDCVLTGHSDMSAPCGALVRSGIELENCADVAVVRCTVSGSNNVPRLNAAPPAAREGTGLFATGSSVALYDSTVYGGSGGFYCTGYVGDGAYGGQGVHLVASFLFASRSALHGGQGTIIPFPPAQQNVFGGNGGDGLVLEASSTAYFLQSTVNAGKAGYNNGCGLCGSCCTGSPGTPIVNISGTTQTLPGTARVLVGAPLARESTALALTATGSPGDIAALAIRRETAFAWTPAFVGVQLLSTTMTPTRYLILGTIPGSGVLTTTLALPAVALSDPGQTYHVQLTTVSSTSTIRLGTPLSLVILDQAY